MEIKNKIDIKVFSRKTVQDFATDRPHIFISVRDPGSEPVDVAIMPHQVARLDLEFSDVDASNKPNLKNIDSIKLFTIDDAQSILRLFQITKPCINLIIINCEAGISRSSGIAAAMTRIMGNSDAEYFSNTGPYCPNRFVYSMLLNMAVQMRLLGDN